MKIRLSNEHGIVLMTTLVIAAVIGVVLASVMVWAGSHNQVTMRSKAWNTSLGVAEAGVEEALAHLKNNLWDRSQNNWSLTNSQYTKTRTFGDGYYTVTISTNDTPTIISKGYVKAPLKANEYISRTVQVITTNQAMFWAGIITRQWVQMGGNSLYVDSFDPNNSTYSTARQYDAAKHHDWGNVATCGGVLNSFSVGNADIYGKVAVGPGGSITYGSGGSIGDLAWVTPGTTGIKPGWAFYDFKYTFTPVVAPTGMQPGPFPGKINGKNYDYLLGTGNYKINDWTGDIYVLGKAKLIVNSKLKVTSSALVFGPGASLELYCNANDASFGGSSIANQGGSCTNFHFYGLPACKSISFSGNTAVTGVFYAPDADLVMGGGGGGTPVDLTGAAVVKTLTMNGRFAIHYDESLRTILPQGVTVGSWKEL